MTKKRMVVGNVKKIENHLHKALAELEQAKTLFDCMSFEDKESIRKMKKVNNYYDELLFIWGHFRDKAEDMKLKKGV